MINRSAGLSTAQCLHSQRVFSIVIKVGHSVVARGVCQVSGISVVYGDLEARVLATGFVPVQDDFCIGFVWTFT